MTSANITYASRERPAYRRALTRMISWWFERRRLRRDYKKLAQMPDHLLRDVGLEHLIDLNRHTDFRHRIL